jgi:cutinase
MMANCPATKLGIREFARIPGYRVGQSYLAKTINLCLPEDPVCTPGGFDGMAHGSYATNGMVAQAADFAAQQVG